MLKFVHGNLLDAPTEALVNAVNTVGVMGKGVALMFKAAFPDNFRAYEDAVKHGEVRIGQMFVAENKSLDGPRWLVNFPTKQHWRHPSKLEWIVDGLTNLREVITNNLIRSIALPALGCGNGGLNWRDVRPEIERAFKDLHAVEVWVYEPAPKHQNIR